MRRQTRKTFELINYLQPFYLIMFYFGNWVDIRSEGTITESSTRGPPSHPQPTFRLSEMLVRLSAMENLRYCASVVRDGYAQVAPLL